jgi:hypothetical protein
MAKVAKNVIVRGISGSIGNLVFRQMKDGSTWVSATPNFSNRKFSRRQKDHQSRFKQAASYARGAAKAQTIYAELAKGTTRNAYNIALSDWFNPPVIHRMERKDGKILIEASDDVKVTRVLVTVLDEEGKVLEQGDAVQKGSKSRLWEYVPHTEGRMVADVWDLAGNRTKLVV